MATKRDATAATVTVPGCLPARHGVKSGVPLDAEMVSYHVVS